MGRSNSLLKQKKSLNGGRDIKEDVRMIILQNKLPRHSVSLCPEWLLDITVEGRAANVHAECNLGTTPDVSLDSGFE